MACEKDRTRRLTVIAQATDACIFNCVYCSADYKNPKGNMNFGTLDNLLHKVASYNHELGSTHIIWHGGEPLLPGLEFYSRVVEIQKSIKDHSFSNVIQSNGSSRLMNEQFLQFLKESDFRIGFSLDGTEFTHDKNRRDKQDNGTFQEVFEGIILARNYGLGGYSCLCVVNQNTINNLGEIYSFFKDNDILHLRFNPQFPKGRAINRPDLAVTPAEYGNAMINLFDIWFNDQTKPVIDIDTFSTYVRGSLTYKTLIKTLGNSKGVVEYIKSQVPTFIHNNVNFSDVFVCSHSNDCFQSYIGVDPVGNVSTCARFLDEGDYYYGNINDKSLDEMLSEQKQKGNAIYRRAQKGIEECKSCEYEALCNGGCAYIAHLINGSPLKPDGFCESYKLLYNHIDKALQN